MYIYMANSSEPFRNESGSVEFLIFFKPIRQNDQSKKKENTDAHSRLSGILAGEILVAPENHELVTNVEEPIN